MNCHSFFKVIIRLEIVARLVGIAGVPHFVSYLNQVKR